MFFFSFSLWHTLFFLLFAFLCSLFLLLSRLCLLLNWGSIWFLQCVWLPIWKLSPAVCMFNSVQCVGVSESVGPFVQYNNIATFALSGERKSTQNLIGGCAISARTFRSKIVALFLFSPSCMPWVSLVFPRFWVVVLWLLWNIKAKEAKHYGWKRDLCRFCFGITKRNWGSPKQLTICRRAG